MGTGRLAGSGRMALVAAAALAGLDPEPAAALTFLGYDLTDLAAPRIEAQSAFGFAIFMGLIVFTLTTALLHLRQRGQWERREAAFASEIAQLRHVHDRAELLIGAERQLVVSWVGRGSEPVLEGDPTVVGEIAGAKRALAFGSWLQPADAAALEDAVETLRERGEAFALTLTALDGRFVECEGRTVSGHALLRLRDVTGDRAERLRVEGELSRLRNDLKTLRGLLDGVQQPVWLRDREGRLEWANAAYLAAVEARDVADARERALELLDRAAREESHKRRAEGGLYAARVPAVVAGARRVLDVTESQAPAGSAGIAFDVSELEGVRADLQRQMQAHVRTLDQLPTAVAMFDAKQRLIFHNAAYRQLWSLDQAFLDSRPVDGEILDRLRAARRLPEQADFRSWKAALLAHYRSLEPHETWWHLPDRRTLRVVTNPNPQGGLTYLFDDVSERFRLESRYNTLIRVQGETLDALREGVAVFGMDGRLKFANRAFLEAWRIDPQTVDEQPHIDQIIRQGLQLSPNEDPWIEIRQAVTGQRDARLGVTCRFERREGTALDCATQPLPDGATLLTFVDVTASVNVERALTEKNDALERAAKLRDEFVHHVSYELRSPLTTIIGFTQLLGDETVGALNARQRDYASHIMRSSAALLAIINDILDLASIDTGSLELAQEPVDIRETIDSAARGVADRFAESDVKLAIEVPPDIGTFVADGKRVRQILFNLLSNAVGFSVPGQTVRVSVRKDAAFVIYEVHDEGKGIPPEVQARVFNRFETHSAGTRHRGVGLGLSIVRSFVELHGGRVELSSAPGSGTTVTCIFPLAGTTSQLAAE